MKTNETYKTSDFMEVCYMLTNDMRLLDAERESSGRVTFLFADRSACEKLANDLAFGRDQVSATKFMDSLRRARKVIHAAG